MMKRLSRILAVLVVLALLPLNAVTEEIVTPNFEEEIGIAAETDLPEAEGEPE